MEAPTAYRKQIIKQGDIIRNLKRNTIEDKLNSIEAYSKCSSLPGAVYCSLNHESGLGLCWDLDLDNREDVIRLFKILAISEYMPWKEAEVLAALDNQTIINTVEKLQRGGE